jgi:hypothetical protein
MSIPEPENVLLVGHGRDGARYIGLLPGRFRIVAVGADTRRFATGRRLGLVWATEEATRSPHYRESIDALLRASAYAPEQLLVLRIEDHLSCSCHPWRPADRVREQAIAFARAHGMDPSRTHEQIEINELAGTATFRVWNEERRDFESVTKDLVEPPY